jgi:chain length determinant protein EpsF
MSLRQFFMILHGRLAVVALVFFATVTAVAVLSVVLPKRYSATAAVLVDVKAPDPISGAMLDGLVMPGYLATQRDIIMSDRVARKAVQLLKLDEGTDAEQRERATTLKKKLDVKPARNSNVIDITFSASDPAFAAAAANAFAQAYREASIEVRVDPARQSTRWFGEQDKMLRDNLDRAQARFSEHQQKHGLGVSEERLDSEVTRLNDLATQLATAQAQAAEANSRQLGASEANRLPEAVQNPLIVALKTQIARQEASLQELAGHLGKNHPEYRRMAAELESLKSRLDAETAVIAGSLRTARSVNKNKEAELAAAVAAQKKKVLAIRQAREQLAALERDRDIAQKAYETVTHRLTQTRLESQLTQSNASILAFASEPGEPVFPNPLLNAVAAIFLGTFLALGVAFVLELIDRRVHTADDLAELLQLPVLAVVPRRRLPAPVPRRRLSAPVR